MREFWSFTLWWI